MFFHGRRHCFSIDADTRSVYHGRRTHQFHSPLVGHGEQMPSGSPRFQSVRLLLPFSRAERAHYRLSWAERLAWNARAQKASKVSIRLFGIPPAFATFLGLSIV